MESGYSERALRKASLSLVVTAFPLMDPAAISTLDASY